MRLTKLKSSAGFTIIELLIATAVLSTILLLVTSLMINIGKLYYKGINQARVQDNVRSITDEVAQHLQLGDSFIPVISGSEQAYCMGTTRYTYILNKQIGSDASTQSLHVLWRDKNPTPGNCPAALPVLTTPMPSSGGSELIAPNARLTDFTITGSSPYSVSVSVAYGDDDLLNLSGVNTKCKGDIGDQFCATAKLQTIVVRRLP
jgi:prepilin-type N-terminal cleavage/methylation domain-containing protein